MAEILTVEKITKTLGGLPGWSCVDGKLHKVLRFLDFYYAFGLIARVAPVGEQRDHLPDWSSSYNSVVLDIVNHSAGGVTQTCIDLAIDVEAIAREMVKPSLD